MKYIIFAILGDVAVYLLFSFAFVSLNHESWSFIGRAICAICMATVIYIISMICFLGYTK